METILIQLFTAALGSLGFALLFNVKKKHLSAVAIGGILTWGVFLICTLLFHSGDFLGAILSAGTCQIYSDFMAKWKKTPATVFYISGLIPLIPGGSLWRTMDAVLTSDFQRAKENGTETLLVSLGIAVGLSAVTTVLHLIRSPKKRKMSKR